MQQDGVTVRVKSTSPYAATRAVVLRVIRRSSTSWDADGSELTPHASLRADGYTAASMSTKAGRRRGGRKVTPSGAKHSSSSRSHSEKGKASRKAGAGKAPRHSTDSTVVQVSSIAVPALQQTALYDYQPGRGDAGKTTKTTTKKKVKAGGSGTSQRVKRSKRTSELARSHTNVRLRSPSSFKHSGRKRRSASDTEGRYKSSSSSATDVGAGAGAGAGAGSTAAWADGNRPPTLNVAAGSGLFDSFRSFGGQAAAGGSDSATSTRSKGHYRPTTSSNRSKRRRSNTSSHSAASRSSKRSGASGRSGRSGGSRSRAAANDRNAKKQWKKGLHAITALKRFQDGGKEWRHSQRVVRERVLAEHRRPIDAIRGNDLCSILRRLFRDCSVNVDHWFGEYDSPGVIRPYLCIGDKYDSKDKAKLLRLGVTHILNVAKQVENAHPMTFIYKKISMVDSEEQDPSKHFGEAFKFIDDARTNHGRCFVHCVAGVSRAAVVVLAYLMKRCNVPLRIAFQQLKYIRPVIHPNERFRLTLAKCEMKWFDGYSSVADFKHELWNFFAWRKLRGTAKKASLPKPYPCCCGLLSCCSCCECGKPYA